MTIEIKMPALSPTMEEGTLAKWLVKAGDSVKSGDILAEIETDKATMEFEAVDEGVVGEILVAEGTDGVKVGTVIATMAGEGETVVDTRKNEVPPPAPPARAEGEKEAKKVEANASPPTLAVGDRGVASLSVATLTLREALRDGRRDARRRPRFRDG